MHGTTLFHQYILQLTVARLLHARVTALRLYFRFQLVYLLAQTNTVVFHLADHPLQVSPALFLVLGDSMELNQLVVQTLFVRLQLLQAIALLLQLPCDVVNMSFQSQNLADKLFFFPLLLLHLIAGPADVLFRTLQLQVQLFVFLSNRMQSLLQLLDLHVGVPVIC